MARNRRAMSGDRELWRKTRAGGEIVCVMRSCCAGAELQLLQNDSIVLRELYPTKSDLYERARDLEREHRSDARTAAPDGLHSL